MAMEYRVRRLPNGGYLVCDEFGRQLIAASDYDRMRKDLKAIMEPAPLPRMSPKANSQTVSTPSPKGRDDG